MENAEIEARILAKAEKSEFLWSKFMDRPEQLSLMDVEKTNSDRIKKYLLLFSAPFLASPKQVKARGLQCENVLTIAGAMFQYPLAYVEYDSDEETIEFKMLIDL